MKAENGGNNRFNLALPTAIATVGWALRKALSTTTAAMHTPGHSSRLGTVTEPHQPVKTDGDGVGASNADSAATIHASAQIPGGKVSVFFATGSLLLGIFAGVGFLYIYWTSANNGWLGATLALSLGFFGAGLVLWSHWLVPHKQVTEPRPMLTSTPQERQEFDRAFASGEHRLERRNLLKWMSAAIAATFAAIAVSVLRSFGKPPGPSLFNTIWIRGQRLVTITGKPVLVDSLQPGSAITVFPEGQVGSVNGQTVLIRVRQEFLNLPKGRADWAPMGYVAYSRVCTHAGCPVGLFESETDLLLCPCHQSTFNVLNGAQPTAGPAARPLPQLPLYADAEGYLRAGGGFSEPPGPGFWSIP